MKIKRITLPVIAVIAAATLAAAAGWLALDNKTHAQTGLSAPANVQVADGDATGEVVVSWNAVDGATGYSVQWVNVDAALVVYDAGGDWEQYIQSADIDGGETDSYTLTVNRPRSGAEYAFAVRSRSGPDTESDWSGWERWVLQDSETVLAAALALSQSANALVNVGSVPTNASMTRDSIGRDRAALARHKASLMEQLPLLEGRGDAMRVARIKDLVGNLISNAEDIQAGRPALLQALAAEEAGQRISASADLFSSTSESTDDQFQVLMDEDIASEADRLRYSHLQSLLANVRQARTLLLVAARLQDPAVVARNQEAYESVAELIRRDIEYLRGNGGPKEGAETTAVMAAQKLVGAGSGNFTRLEKRLELTATERALIARNAADLARLRAELGALVTEAQGMTPDESPPPPPTGTPGVDAQMVAFGQSAALMGPSAQLGKDMQLGILAAFKEANDNDGVHGRQLNLTTRDDRYEADLAFAMTRQLLDQVGVFGLIGAVGTPTSRAALPLAEAGDVPFVGAFTGAQLLREDDQKFILNVRASYHDETERMVEYLNRMGKTKVAVLYQNDSYGQDGLEGVRKALDMRDGMDLVSHWYYPRNTTAVKAAAFRINKAKPDAVIIIGAYAPTAKFIEQLRMRMMDDPVFMAVSFVGSNALRDELVRLEEPTSDVYVTQVVPLPSDESNDLVARYRTALSAYNAQAEPGFVSLEGYLAGRLAIEGLKGCGAELTQQCFLDAVRNADNLSLDGFELTFGPNDNQGSDAVFLTRINDAGQFELVAE